MNLFDYAYFAKFEDNLHVLANRIALSEPWGYTYPEKEYAEGKCTTFIRRNLETLNNIKL